MSNSTEYTLMCTFYLLILSGNYAQAEIMSRVPTIQAIYFQISQKRFLCGTVGVGVFDMWMLPLEQPFTTRFIMKAAKHISVY